MANNCVPAFNWGLPQPTQIGQVLPLSSTIRGLADQGLLPLCHQRAAAHPPVTPSEVGPSWAGFEGALVGYCRRPVFDADA